MEKYSVLMSLYKNEKPEYLQLAIESMLNQTITPDEITIVKDGVLTPELDAVLEEYKEKNTVFNIVGYEVNRGLGYALNFGLEHCRNELVARMDTDDIAEHDRCEKQLKMFEQDSSLEIVGGDISEFIDAPENIVTYRKVPTADKEIKDYMKVRCPFNHMTVMYKKEAVLRSGNYLDLFWNEDYFLWIRMMEHGCIMGNTGSVLVNVRVGNDMYKRRGGVKYYQSEKYLQQYLRNHQIIGRVTYILNLSKRFVVQKLLPNKIRGIVFRIFARS